MITCCPLCSSRGGRLSPRYLPGYSLGGGEKFYQCLNCGLISLYPFPAENKLLALYRSGQYHDRYRQQQMDWIGGSKQLAPYLKQRLIRLEKLIKGRGRILDVGAGSSVFLAEAKKRGWQVQGVEIDPQAVRYAKRQFGISLLKSPKGVFDVVHLNHVLEHVYDPVGLLTKIKSLLNPRGHLMVEVPNEINSLSELIQFYLSYKSRWRCLSEKVLLKRMPLVKLPPSLHLFFFSAHSLKRLLRRLGFKIIEIQTSRRNQSTDKMIYRAPWIAPLIYFLEKRFDLGPNLEVLASV